MESKNVVTYLWSENKSVFTSTFNRGKSASNFSEFIFSYPLPKDKLFSCLMRVVNLYNLNDVTNTVLLTEDSVLFDATAGSAIDIVIRYLHTLNTGGKVNSLWSYLDEDKKAVVHFINKKGWYAEVYFLCNEEFSALHLITNGTENILIPVVFTADLSKEMKLASLSGGTCLQKYLPRVKGDFLGGASSPDKGQAKCGKASKKQQHNHFKKDRGDGL